MPCKILSFLVKILLVYRPKKIKILPSRAISSYICPVIHIYALCTGLYTGVFFFGRYCSVNLRFWNSYIALSFYQFSVFSEWPILILDRILELSYWIVLIAEREKKWHIYYIYGVLSGYIQRYSRLNLGFFRPRQKNSLGQGRCPREFFGLGRKKTSVSGLYHCI